MSSIFKFLRSQAKVFYWVIAATFVLFLILGGLTGRGCQAPGVRQYEPGVIGTVNGQKLSAELFDYVVRSEVAAMRQQAPDRDLNANQYAAARERAWDAIVQEAIVEQAIAERDIEVTDAEVLDVFENDPPPELLAQYRDDEGNIDINRYYADLQNPAADWSRAEEWVRSQIPRRKLVDLVTADVVVGDDEVRQEYLRQNGRAVAEWIGALFSELDLEYTPGDAEVTAWYEAHPEDFARDAMAKAKVVRFAKTPSDADYADVLSYANDIREEIVSGQTDFAAAAAQYSEDPGSAARGGDLGRFDRNRMVAPFTEAAFSLPVGQISEPVKTRFGYHLIEVLEQDIDKDTGEVYEVAARHILLKVAPGPDTLAMVRDAAEDFRSRVDGGSFVATAEAEAHDLLDPEPVAPGRDIPSLPMSLSGSHWLFAAEPGQVSPVFENDDCCYVVLAEARIPAGVRPLDEVRGQITQVLLRERRLATARAKLSPAVGAVQMGSELSAAAAEHDLRHAVTDTITWSGNVAEVGYATDFNKLVIEGEVGSLIPEIETLRGLFAAVPRWIQPLDQAAFLRQSPALRAQLLARKRSEAFGEWLQERIAAAEIVDLRYRARPSA